jgi:hypothetical protein
MHIKFLRAGRSGQKAAAYLLKKRQDEEVIVRRGDPVFFADLVDSLGYKNPYSSAVVAFAPGDKPTEEQIEEVIEGFKQTAWAGLREEDFCILVVEHRKKNGEGTHLHFLVANYHLSRKRYFEPAPPGWQRRYYPFRNYLNAKYGWARPDDEKRARKVQPFPGMGAEKQQVLGWAEAMAEMGLSTAEIAEVARASGAKVPRMGTNYVTLAWGRQRVRVRTEKKKRKEVETATIEEQERKWQRVLERIATKNREKYEQKGEREHGKARERNYTGERNCISVTGASRDSLPGVPTRSAAGAAPDLEPGGVVVLPPDALVGMVRGPRRGLPRRMRCPGAGEGIMQRITRGRNGIRIGWAHQESNGTAIGRGGGDGTPTRGIGSHGEARHSRTSRITAETRRPDAGMGGLWQALERLFGRLGEALGRANETARRLYTAACRVVTGGMSPAGEAERGAEQAGQQPATRREVPKADVPKRDWPRRGWPPGRQGPGWG